MIGRKIIPKLQQLSSPSTIYANSMSQPCLPFYEAVLKRKIAQICESVGYSAISEDSLNILFDFYARCILELGVKCKDAANRNRRSEVALVDLVQAYDLIGISIPELKAHMNEVKLPFPVQIETHEPEPANRVQRNLIVQEEDKDTGQQGNSEIINDGEECDENGGGGGGGNADNVNGCGKPELLSNRFLELVNKFDDCPPVSALKFEPPKQQQLEQPKEHQLLLSPPQQQSQQLVVVSPPKPKLKVKVKVKPLQKKKKGKEKKEKKDKKEPSKLKISKLAIKTPTPVPDRDPTPLPSPKAPPTLKVRIPSPLPPVPRDPTPTPSPLAQSVIQVAPSISLKISTPPPLTPGAQDAELCPTCNLPDDGSMMIQCDNMSCAKWFHGNCVGVTQELEENVTWFCLKCIKTKETPQKRSSKKKIEVNKPLKSLKRAKEKKAKESTKKTPTPPMLTPPPPAPVVSTPPPITPGENLDLCPTCKQPDDGSMMIQCDDPTCARWFHVNCVGLTQEPADDESWFCKGCIEKQQSAFSRRRAK